MQYHPANRGAENVIRAVLRMTNGVDVTLAVDDGMTGTLTEVDSGVLAVPYDQSAYPLPTLARWIASAGPSTKIERYLFELHDRVLTDAEALARRFF